MRSRICVVTALVVGLGLASVSQPAHASGGCIYVGVWGPEVFGSPLCPTPPGSGSPRLVVLQKLSCDTGLPVSSCGNDGGASGNGVSGPGTGCYPPGHVGDPLNLRNGTLSLDPIGQIYNLPSPIVDLALEFTDGFEVDTSAINHPYNYVENSPFSWIDPYGWAKGKNRGGKALRPNPNKRKGSELRQKTGDRQRNLGHPGGEEHSRVPKGRGGAGPRGRGPGFAAGCLTTAHCKCLDDPSTCCDLLGYDPYADQRGPDHP